MSHRSHPRVSVNALSSASWTLAQDLEFWNRHGIQHVSISLRKVMAAGWDRGIAALRESALTVSAVLWPTAFHLDAPARWAEEQAAAKRAVDAAVMLGAKCLAMTAGPPGRMLTDEAAAAFASAIAPVLEHARAQGVAIALENNSPLRRDIGFLHTLTDTVTFAREIGIGVCVELNNCWTEYHLADIFHTNHDIFGIVQVSDYVIGTTTTPDRAVPPDGDIPLERLLRMLLDAGYAGPFDLEIVGPRIEAEGYPGAILRGLEWLSGTIERLGG